MPDIMYHIQVDRERKDLPRYMITCGDPKRAQWIAKDFLTDSYELAHNREYWSLVPS